MLWDLSDWTFLISKWYQESNGHLVFTHQMLYRETAARINFPSRCQLGSWLIHPHRCSSVWIPSHVCISSLRVRPILTCQGLGLVAVLGAQGHHGIWWMDPTAIPSRAAFLFPSSQFSHLELLTSEPGRSCGWGRNGRPPPPAQPSGHHVSPVGLTPNTSSLQPPTPFHLSVPSKNHSFLLSCSEVYFHLSLKVTRYTTASPSPGGVLLLPYPCQLCVTFLLHLGSLRILRMWWHRCPYVYVTTLLRLLQVSPHLRHISLRLC